MTIRQKLWIISFSIVLINIMILFVFYRLFMIIDDAGRKAFAADRIVVDISDLNILTYDYVLNPGERLVQQWKSKHASMGEHIAETSATFGSDVVFERIRKNHHEIFTIFDELIGITEKIQEGPLRDTSLLDDNSERLVSQLISRSQMMSIDIHALMNESSAATYRTGKKVLAAILMLILASMLISFALVFVIARRISADLQKVKEGTRIIASGDLDYVLPIRRKDEIAELAADFNEMTRKLRKTYSDLNEEIRARKEMEDALKESEASLQKSYAELENRVEERTADLRKTAEQLETANAELESFSYSVSHDLRAPLRAIDGFSQMLLKDMEGKLDSESARKFKVISDNAEKMGRLIDDILAYSRSARTFVSFNKVEIRQGVEDIWRELQAGNPGRQMELIIGDLPTALGDRTLLRQVFSNLLGNAVKFTRNTEKAVIEVYGIQKGAFNTYCVKDNGVGFDMRYYGKLFEIFRRLHSDKDFEGTGVGLAIVKKIVQKHGGTIWAEAKPGAGATFCFTLPHRQEGINI